MDHDGLQVLKLHSSYSVDDGHLKIHGGKIQGNESYVGINIESEQP